MDDLYSPEQAANLPIGGTGTTGLPQGIYFDSIRADFVLNQFRGFDHTSVHQVGVPTLFGMNPFALDGARLQGTHVLPGFDAAIQSWLQAQTQSH